MDEQQRRALEEAQRAYLEDVFRRYEEEHQVFCRDCGVQVPPRMCFTRFGELVNDRCPSCYEKAPKVSPDDPDVQWMRKVLDSRPWQE